MQNSKCKAINGRKIAEEVLRPVKKEIARLTKGQIVPHLAIILVGNDAESIIYIKEKQKKAKELGVKITLFQYKEKSRHEEIVAQIAKLNQDKNISGILLQLPLPKSFDTDKIINSIDPKKDVDGLRPNSPYPMPCVSAILKILAKEKIGLKNKKIVIIGIGRLVGKPLFKIFKERKYNVSLISSQDKNLPKLVKSADILICASKNKNIIKKGMIKEGAVVIDAACNVKTDAIKNALCITPQIGGVGPITVAILLQNVVASVGA